MRTLSFGLTRFGLVLPRGLRAALMVAAVAIVVLALMVAGAGPSGLVASGLLFAGMAGTIMDELTEFADATSVAAIASTALIGDVIPLTVARDIGTGEPIYLVITVDTEIITAGAAGTIKFQLVSDAQAAIATDGTATVHLDTGTFVTDDAAANDAQMNAGGVIFIGALPSEGHVYEAYLGLLCIIGTTTVTAGKINAFLTRNPGKWKASTDQF
jgi:hypothetical protein